MRYNQFALRPDATPTLIAQNINPDGVEVRLRNTGVCPVWIGNDDVDDTRGYELAAGDVERWWTDTELYAFASPFQPEGFAELTVVILGDPV